ncbi:hypothetical protein Tco_0704673 [Tanacetum coccineum]|uniref:Gag-Pol polyprotein n=1 Tax=Tanacetum coccineum TaxID=301880 RepID=A0ABQ4Y4A1_9ASTR
MLLPVNNPSTVSKQWHNNIMAAGSKDHPPMLGPGRYSQWRSRFLWVNHERKDVKDKLFWEFGKFTYRDGESMELYYSRFYKLMNELTRNNLQVTAMQVNVQFLQQLQPEWSRFVTVVKHQKKIEHHLISHNFLTF